MSYAHLPREGKGTGALELRKMAPKSLNMLYRAQKCASGWPPSAMP